MTRSLLAATVAATICCTSMLSANEFRPQQFSVEEIRPVLEAISRLDRVVVVPPSPYVPIGWPQICFWDSVEFRPLTQMLFGFKGNADWAVISDLPRACVSARLRMIPPDASPESLVAKAREAATVDIPQLSFYLNAIIGETTPANGIAVQDAPLEMSLMYDAAEPAGVIYLVRDPILFLKNRLAPTSEYDRALHFWLKGQEEGKVREQLRLLGGETFRLLDRLVNGGYGQAVVNPEEVERLISECDSMRETSNDADVRMALTRIESIANSAKNYQLGICRLGD